MIYYELGNEPDNQAPINHGWVYGCWGNGDDQTDHDNAGGGKYAGFMAKAYTAMKLRESDIIVTMGGLAYDNWDPGGPFDPDFVDAFLTKGGGAYVDAINYHYFKAFAYLWGSVVGKGQYLQGQFAQYGYANLPLIVTEFGDPSQGPTTTTSSSRLPNRIPGFKSAPKVVATGDYWSELSAKLAATSPDAVTYSTDEQANYVIVGFTRGMAHDIHPMLWFQAVDRPAQSGGYRYGLLDTGLSAKPSYTAYKTLAAELTGLVYSQPLTFLGDSVAEGYEFTGGGETRWVVWRNAGISLHRDFTVGSGNALRVVQTDGTEVTIIDGETGDLDSSVNGFVRIMIGPSPQILEPLVCTAASQIADVSVAVSSGDDDDDDDDDDVELSWEVDLYALSYDIWRSDTAPYFEPVPGVDTPHDDDDAPPYLDVGALAAPYPKQHFYLVTGQNVCEQSSGLSNRTGAFQFVLVPGS
ncbi:MAG: hypothetical protein GY759_20530 [Chloroflexi bacterium]|nr:hypothetical protein [Chloroflexota bacterium]